MSPKRSPRRGRRPNSPAQPPRSTALLKHEFVSPASMLEHGDLLKEDLHSFGFAKEAIQRMLKKPEPVVDSFAQVVHGSYARLREERERKREAFDRKNAARKRRKGSEEGSPKGRKGEQQIYLDRPGGSWVLFDPAQGWPPTISEPPALYERYSHFAAGSRKVVAYNIESHAIALRKTPEEFRGCTVHYSRGGPKLVKASTEAVLENGVAEQPKQYGQDRERLDFGQKR